MSSASRVRTLPPDDQRGSRVKLSALGESDAKAGREA